MEGIFRYNFKIKVMYYKFNKDTMLYEKTSITSRALLGFGAVIGILTIFGLNINSNKRIETLSPEEKLIILREANSFSEQKLIESIKELNFKFPHIVLAQAKLESSNFSSPIFLENNNLFGMKEAKVRANLAIGTKRSHAFYKNWKDSLLDYALYYSTYLSKIRTESEYFDYLNQSYAQDPNYVVKLKNIIRKQNLK
jgi:hypothetical protein